MHVPRIMETTMTLFLQVSRLPRPVHDAVIMKNALQCFILVSLHESLC
jgi:hypothetical protein